MPMTKLYTSVHPSLVCILFCINPTFPHFIIIIIIIIIAAVVIIIAIVTVTVAVGVTLVADTHHTENLNIQSHYCPDRL